MGSILVEQKSVPIESTDKKQKLEENIPQKNIDVTNSENEMEDNKQEKNLDEALSSGLKKFFNELIKKDEVEPKKEQDLQNFVAVSDYENIQKELQTLKADFENLSNEKSELELKIKDLEEKNASLEEDVKNKLEEATNAKYVLEAQSDFTYLAGTSKETAKKLREIDESTLSDELKAEMRKELKEKSDKLKQMSDEVGVEGGSDDSELSDEQAIEKKMYEEAEKIAQKENITVQQALRKVSIK